MLKQEMIGHMQHPNIAELLASVDKLSSILKFITWQLIS